nr:hypothetical protein [uncultured Dyadobacter sp.]
MLKIKGIYQNGRIQLDQNPTISQTVKVIVTFPEIDTPSPVGPKILAWPDFSFDKSRQLLKSLKSSLSEEVIAERRNS